MPFEVRRRSSSILRERGHTDDVLCVAFYPPVTCITGRCVLQLCAACPPPIPLPFALISLYLFLKGVGRP